MIKMGKRYLTRVKGRDVTVTALWIEQSINSRHRGKWVCLNEETSRHLRRTRRQLRPLKEQPKEQP
jgi:hypothetical protein